MLPQNGSSFCSGFSSDTGTGFSLSSSICLPEAECERTEVWAVQWQTKDYPCPYFTRCFGHNTISLYTTQHSAHTHTHHTNTHVYLQAAGWLLLLLLKRWSNEKKCQLVQRETATAAAAAIAGTATAAAAGSTAAQPALEVWAQQKAATTTATTTKHVSNARHSEEY